MNLGLGPVRVLKRGPVTFCRGDAFLGQFVQVPRLGWDQLNEEVLQHPGESVVRHDPDSEAWTIGMNDLQPACWHLLRQRRKLIVNAALDLIPSFGCVTVCIYDNTWRLKSRGSYFGPDHARFQQLFYAAIRLDMDNRLSRNLPFNTVALNQKRNHTFVGIALYQQLPRVGWRRQLPYLRTPLGCGHDFFVIEADRFIPAWIDSRNRHFSRWDQRRLRDCLQALVAVMAMGGGEDLN